MAWHKRTNEEVEELRRFVEEMKRGTTPATGDSLLETLRQIHDRREALAPDPDHRRLLLDRLRRELAARDGVALAERPVLTFARTQQPPLVLRWALAASLVLHAGCGVFVLSWLHSNSSAIALALGEPAPPAVEDFSLEDAIFLPLANPALEPSKTGNSGGRRGGRASSAAVGDRARAGAFRETPSRSGARAAVRPAPPPIALAAGPMLGDISASSDLMEREIEGENYPFLTSPDSIDTFTEVAGESYDNTFDEAPRIISTVKPFYPPRALGEQVQGKVRVQAVFGADGRVRDIRVVRGLGYGLDEAAVQAVRQIRFKPATRDGVPVAAMMTFTVSFGIR